MYDQDTCIARMVTMAALMTAREEIEERHRVEGRLLDAGVTPTAEAVEYATAAIEYAREGRFFEALSWGSPKEAYYAAVSDY